MAREEKRWKERVQRSACVRSAVWHYAWARKAGLKRANKKVVKASTGGGGCTYRGISYWRRRGLLPRAACLSSLFWCASSLLLHYHFLFPLRFNHSTLFNSFLSFFFLLFFVVDRMLAFHFLSVRVLYYLATPSYLMFFFFRHSCSCIIFIRIRYYSIIDSIITFCFTRKYSSFHCF